jgi:hypothetical protein
MNINAQQAIFNAYILKMVLICIYALPLGIAMLKHVNGLT